MSLANVRFQIAASLREALPEAYVYEHGGTFGEGDIKKYSQRSPALVVACLGVPEFEIQGGSTLVARAAWGVFAIAKDTAKPESRDVAALILMESAAAETVQNFWNDAASSTPMNLTGANLFTRALDDMGVAMWGLRWEQKVECQRNTLAHLEDFLTMTTTYDIGETDDTVDTTDTTTLPT